MGQRHMNEELQKLEAAAQAHVQPADPRHGRRQRELYKLLLEESQSRYILYLKEQDSPNLRKMERKALRSAKTRLPNLANLILKCRFDPQCWYYEPSVKELGAVAFPYHHYFCNGSWAKHCREKDEDYRAILELVDAPNIAWQTLEFGSDSHTIPNCHLLLRRVLRGRLRANCKHLKKFTYNMLLEPSFSNIGPEISPERKVFEGLQEVLTTAGKIEHLGVSNFELLTSQAPARPHWTHLKKLCISDSTIEWSQLRSLLIDHRDTLEELSLKKLYSDFDSWQGQAFLTKPFRRWHMSLMFHRKHRRLMSKQELLNLALSLWVADEAHLLKVSGETEAWDFDISREWKNEVDG